MHVSIYQFQKHSMRTCLQSDSMCVRVAASFDFELLMRANSKYEADSNLLLYLLNIYGWLFMDLMQFSWIWGKVRTSARRLRFALHACEFSRARERRTFAVSGRSGPRAGRGGRAWRRSSGEGCWRGRLAWGARPAQPTTTTQSNPQLSKACQPCTSAKHSRPLTRA